MTSPASRITLAAVLRRFPMRTSITMLLVLLEALTALLFPLLIGMAIDDLIDGVQRGLWWLAGLGFGALVIGSARRFFDTRAYGHMYRVMAAEIAAQQNDRKLPISTIVARSQLLAELVEFLENSLPMLVTAGMSLVGSLAILLGLDARIGCAAGALALLVLAVYGSTARTNLRLTTGYNDELERRVASLQTRRHDDARQHFARLMRWNRRLSDLETINYIVIVVGALALLVYCPLVLVAETPQYGAVLAAVMYVFQYIESILELPGFIQQGIRLREISSRL